MTEIAQGVLVTHSRRDTTASTVLTDNGRAVLIDPAWDPDELDDLAQFITNSALGVVAGFATHAHHDHLLWHPEFGEVPRWASAAAARTARVHRGQLVNSLGPDWPEPLAAFVGLVEPLAQQNIPWPGPTAEIIVHDGHSTGHAAVWLEGSRVLLAGDMLSDIELPLAEETGLEAYDRALVALAPYVRRARILVPGHGHPTDSPIGRWVADRRYLDAVLAGRPVEDARLATPAWSPPTRRTSPCAEAEPRSADLEDRFHFDRRAQRQLRYAYRRPGVPARVAEDLDEQVGRQLSIPPWLRGEPRRRVDETDDLHKADDVVEADRSVCGGQYVERRLTRIGLRVLRALPRPDLAGSRQLAVHERELARGVEQRSRLHRRQIGTRRSGDRRELDAQLLQAFEHAHARSRFR